MDAYDLQARQAPLVFAVLPVLLVAIALIPGLGNTRFVTGGIAFVIIGALLFVGTRFARSAGRARQDALFASWGGIPTTAMLRYRDTRVNAQTKRLFRERLAKLGSDFPVPSEDYENRDPSSADVQLGAAMDEIRRRAKMRTLKAVHRENINYGAARNAYGLKPFGLGASCIAAAFLAGAIALRPQHPIAAVDVVVGMGIIVITATWVFACTKHSVRQHAEAYALTLFEAIDELVTSPSRRKKS